MFEKAYQINCEGKRDYFGVEEKGDKLYCLVAMDCNFYLKILIDNYLQKNENMKAIA